MFGQFLSQGYPESPLQLRPKKSGICRFCQHSSLQRMRLSCWCATCPVPSVIQGAGHSGGHAQGWQQHRTYGGVASPLEVGGSPHHQNQDEQPSIAACHQLCHGNPHVGVYGQSNGYLVAQTRVESKARRPTWQRSYGLHVFAPRGGHPTISQSRDDQPHRNCENSGAQTHQNAMCRFILKETSLAISMCQRVQMESNFIITHCLAMNRKHVNAIIQ